MRFNALSCCLLILAMSKAKADWRLDLLVYRYYNEYSQALQHYNSELCCDVDGDSSDDVCTDECDTKFRFCAQPYHTIRSGVCPFGVYDTDVVGGDEINFQPYTETELSPGVPNPMTFGGTEWPSDGVRVFITVTDDDRNSGDDIVALFLLPLLNGPARDSSRNFSEVQTLDAPPLATIIDVAYRLMCSETYYGGDCSVFCGARDDDSGHYTCDTQGSIVCNNGYQGTDTNCTTPTCDPVCSNSGVCIGPNTCQCIDGWSGDGCIVPVCNTPCNNGICVAPNTCQCSDGYKGLNCEDLIALSSTDAVTPSIVAVITGGTSNRGMVVGVSVALTIAVMVAIVLAVLVVLLLVMRRRHAQVDKGEISSPGYNRVESMGLAGDYYSITDDLLSNNMKNLENPTYGCEQEPETELDTHSLGVESEYSLASSPAIVDEVIYSTANRNNSNGEVVWLREPTRPAAAKQDSVYYSKPMEPADVVYYSEPKDPHTIEPVYYSEADHRECATLKPAGQESSHYSTPPNNRESIYYSQAREPSGGARLGATGTIYSSSPTDDRASIDNSGEYAYADNRSMPYARMDDSENSFSSSFANGHYEMDSKLCNSDSQEPSHFYHEVRNTI